METPVLFLIFNRPDTTARVFERIREIRPARLYVAADGPRAGKGEEEACRLTREVTESIDWPCEVERLYRDRNLGCRNAVASAITWFFEHVEAGIIIEDDCLTHPSFFRFAEEMLDRHADDPEVMMISAANFQKEQQCGADSYYYSRYPHIWGWASWRRVWQGYDPLIDQWPASRPSVRSRIITPGTFRLFASCFDKVKSGETNTWDYQLVHHLFVNRGMAVIPCTNLVQNIGFEGPATHTAGHTNLAADEVTEGISFPLHHPAYRKLNDAADLCSERICFGGTRSLRQQFARAVRKIRSLLHSPKTKP